MRVHLQSQFEDWLLRCPLAPYILDEVKAARVEAETDGRIEAGSEYAADVDEAIANFEQRIRDVGTYADDEAGAAVGSDVDGDGGGGNGGVGPTA